MTQPLMSRIQERRGSKVGPLSRLPERRSHCRDCGMTHGRLRYVHPAQKDPQGSSLLELVTGIVVIVIWFAVLFVALPVVLS